MLDRPLVAIAIVTYNSSRFIRQCLKYVFEQDYQPLMAIVIDNASSDETASILREFTGRIQVAYNR
jgi:glycosyltransferase involved in cell wall biosynthesis